MRNKNKAPKKRTLKHTKINRSNKQTCAKRLEKLKENGQINSLVAKHLQNRLKELNK